MAVMGIPDGSGRLVPRKASARSRVSNGGHILPDVDGRSAVARRYRDIAAQIIADMGGASQCAEARLQLIRRFAAAAVLAEQMEARLANGHSINITDHALLSSTLVRLAQRIGIDRRSRNTTPSRRNTSNCSRSGLMRRLPNESFADTIASPRTDTMQSRSPHHPRCDG